MALIKEIQPTIVVQLGDIYDLFSMSKFARPADFILPSEEVKEARELAVGMWKQIRKNTPGVQCYQLMGNHDVRPRKRLEEKLPELACFSDFNSLWKFDGVNTIYDPREALILDCPPALGKVVFTHGWMNRMGAHLDFFNNHVVFGHLHRAWAISTERHKTLYELCCGYLGDPKSIPLSYTANKHNKWTHGLGVIDENGMRFIGL